MKKLTLSLAAMALSATFLFAAACGETTNFVVNDATDLLQEDFGIAVKKGDTETLNAVNAVIDEWTQNGSIEKYLDYYNDLADESKTPTAPDGLKVTWDLSSYTDTLDMFTEATFAPFEFPYAGGYTVSDGSKDESVVAISGLDVAIACAAAEKLQCKLVIHNVDFDGTISHLMNTEGKAIVAAGMSITDERKQQVDFSSIYHSSTLSIVCAEGAGYTTLKSLDGLKIGVQQGTSGDINATAATSASGYSYTTENDNGDEEVVTIKFGSDKTEIARYQTYAAALAALKSGKIDVIFMDKVPALLLVANS